MATKIDHSILSAALLGYQTQLAQINRKIQEIRTRLKDATAPSAPEPAKPRRNHIISAEGRARIAAAQRKRWEEAKQRSKE